jgi:hypothetical protein
MNIGNQINPMFIFQIMKRIIYIGLVLNFCLSCNGLTGIRKSKQLSINEIKTLATKNGIQENLYFVDSRFAKSFLQMVPKNADKHSIKNHLQPIQAMYFDKDGHLISYFINCYASPTVFNLKWNDKKYFDTFPPLTKAPIDSLITLNQLTTLLKPVKRNDIIKPNEFAVIVFWNHMFYRYSKSLLKQIRRNVQNRTSVNLLFVNNDNYLAQQIK